MGISGGMGASAGHCYVSNEEFNAFFKAHGCRRRSLGKGEFREARRGLSRRVEETDREGWYHDNSHEERWMGLRCVF